MFSMNFNRNLLFKAKEKVTDIEPVTTVQNVV